MTSDRIRKKLILRTIDELGSEFYWEDLVNRLEKKLGRKLSRGELTSLGIKLRQMGFKVNKEYTGKSGRGNMSYRKLIIF